MADQSKPYIAADKTVLEITFRSLFLGVILALVLGAANAYLALYAGMTVSASIPAAVISMAILRGILKRGTILENNIVQSIASSGEALAAGIIFTVPALVIVGAWQNFEFWPTFFISVCGGLLGIVFMIPMRRALIVEEKDLTYPEGLACGEVLIAGDAGGAGVKPIIWGAVLGGLLKFGSTGVVVIKGAVEVAGRWGNSVVYFGSDISAALLGVGYIVKLRIGALVFLGGAIGWIVGVPLMSGDPGFFDKDPLEAAWMIWKTKVRYMGVGAMLVGGLWSIVHVRQGITRSLKRLAQLSKGFGAGSTIERTDRDMPLIQLGFIFVVVSIATFFLFQHLIGSTKLSFIVLAIALVASFFFTAVSCYICGLVGSSNTPVSGMTICALLATCGLFYLLGYTGFTAIIAVLGVAGVVCCAACTANDIAQDLKTGVIVGATPQKMQWVEILGAIAPAFIIPAVLTLLHSTYGIGTGLKAPQATLFASIVQGFFGDGVLPWNMVIIGIFIGVGLIILNTILQKSGSSFRTPIMPVAIGIYLPLTLSVPIFLGGIVRTLVDRARGKSGQADEGHDYGILLSSGLIAGEALMGIFIAALIGAGLNLPFTLLENSGISVFALLLLVIFMFVKGKTRIGG